jgi:hypothetical protein
MQPERATFMRDLRVSEFNTIAHRYKSQRIAMGCNSPVKLMLSDDRFIKVCESMATEEAVMRYIAGLYRTATDMEVSKLDDIFLKTKS